MQKILAGILNGDTHRFFKKFLGSLKFKKCMELLIQSVL